MFFFRKNDLQNKNLSLYSILVNREITRNCDERFWKFLIERKGIPDMAKTMLNRTLKFISASWWTKLLRIETKVTVHRHEKLWRVPERKSAKTEIQALRMSPRWMQRHGRVTPDRGKDGKVEQSANKSQGFERRQKPRMDESDIRNYVKSNVTGGQKPQGNLKGGRS